MHEGKFSHFDRVLSPVILYTGNLDFLYANDAAARTYPWLTSVGLRLFCTEPALSVARKRIAAGHAVILPMESDLQYELVFQPVFDLYGTVEYVFCFVHCASLSAEDAVFAADLPLLRLIRKEVLDPVLDFIALLDGEPFRSVDPKYGQVLAIARKRLVRAGTFLIRTEDVDLRGEESLRICEAGEVLSLCAKCFVSMKFSPSERLYLPVGRDALIRIMTDVITFLSVHRADRGHLMVSLEHDERENEIRIVTPTLNPIADSSVNAPLGDLSFLQHRLSSMGGRVEVHPRKNGSFRVSLIFPQIRLSLSDVVVGDSAESLAYSSELLLEFLRDLSEGDSPEEKT